MEDKEIRGPEQPEAEEAAEGREPAETEGAVEEGAAPKRAARKRKAVAIAAAVIVVAGLGLGVAAANGAFSPAPGQEAQGQASQAAGSEDLAEEPRPVAVSIEAEGWKPENGAFTLLVKDAEGGEAARLLVMPEGNGGMGAEDAMAALPEEQYEGVKAAYATDDGEGAAESPVLMLAPGGYTAELADMPTLEDGSTYKLPDAAAFEVGPMKKEGDGSVAAKIGFALERIDPEDEEAVEAAIEALPEDQREAARQQYRKKAEDKHQAAPGGNAGGGGAAANPGGGSGNGGTPSSGGNGGGNGGSTSGGGTSEPEPPAHVHSFDIPIVESQWQDGEGYQRVPRYYVIDANYNKIAGPFSSEDAAYSWAVSNEVGSVLDDSYDTWTKQPGYYDVVVGYQCACGARG